MDMISFITDSYRAAEKNMEQFWSIYLFSLSNISRFQEQYGQTVRDYMNKNNSKRTDFAVYMENMALQFKENQQQYQNMLKETFSYWAENSTFLKPNLFFPRTFS